MAEDFLLEIGTEEIPAAFLPGAIRNLREKGAELFDVNRLGYASVEAMATPRRLALIAYGLADEQGESVQEISGPPRSVAYDPDGAPTQVLLKFCNRHGVTPEQTSIVEKPKGEYVFLRKVEAGRRATEVLPEVLPPWITALTFPKSMRWGNQDIRFARPIRWIAALHGSATIRFRVGNLESGASTRGHRFMGDPGPIRIESPAGYRQLLEENRVVLDPEERRRHILEQARALAVEVGGELIEDEDLIQTLVFITEYPVAVRGTFHERFLTLPKEVLIAPMKGHQKYFSVKRTDGNGLLPYFVTVANVEAPDMSIVRRGNEKVLTARLEDAKFFFEEDTKRPLESYVASLNHVIYHKKLGTSLAKVERIEALAGFLGERICPERQSALRRAARLCKADLVTLMVTEFPELQGTVGGLYAAASGEPDGVVDGIREHYLPDSAEDDLPESLEGAVLSIADKTDTLVGFFGIGSPVSGTSDPFGMRRRAIGILRILLARDLEISLPELVEKGLQVLGGLVRKSPGEVQEEVAGFFRLRYQQFLLTKGFPHDTVKAVLSRSLENIPDLYRRVETLHSMRSEPDFEKLIFGCKRAVNILQQAEKDYGYAGTGEPLREEDLVEDAEKALLASTEEVGRALAGLGSDEYEKLLQRLIGLKEPIDRLFDEVMILVDDESIREKRLNLLGKVSNLFQWFADFSKISL